MSRLRIAQAEKREHAARASRPKPSHAKGNAAVRIAPVASAALGGEESGQEVLSYFLP